MIWLIIVIKGIFRIVMIKRNSS